MIFRGAGVALATPFTQDGIAFDVLEKLVEFQIDGHIDALIACGTTGEPATMTMEEQRSVIDCVIKTAAGRVPVIAGIGGNHTERVAACAKMAKELGADGLLAVTPYYNKCTNAGLVAHFSAVSKASDLPIILYNVPSRTGVNICPAVYAELCENEHIAGIKEASGNISQVVETARVTRGKAALYSGNDDQIVPLLSLGGDGVISVLANIMPKYVHDMVASYHNGEVETARDMQLAINPLISALFTEVNPIPIKTALRMMGFVMGPLRLPLTEMSEQNYNNLQKQMHSFGLCD
ncbi:MAG: 4-hydroxy-tetrahydrodipicolinate synthase [Christensenella sp.]|nr:4-hydroxy-tetrahydrodipicolinate synthase [Christensenella sp.]